MILLSENSKTNNVNDLLYNIIELPSEHRKHQSESELQTNWIYCTLTRDMERLQNTLTVWALKSRNVNRLGKSEQIKKETLTF